MRPIADVRYREAINMRRAWQKSELASFPTSRGAPLDEQFDASIIKRKHVVTTGFGPPALDQFPQLFRLRVGEIVAFREIRVGVIQGPLIIIKRLCVTMSGDRFPSVRRERRVPQLLLVLHAATANVIR